MNEIMKSVQVFTDKLLKVGILEQKNLNGILGNENINKSNNYSKKHHQ
jgi:hypothetical protein